MKRIEKITSTQFLIIIFIVKLFFFMMYTPKTGKSMESTVYMLGQLVSLPLLFLALLPFYYLNMALPGYNIIDCGGKINSVAGKITGVLYYCYMIFSVVNTVINFDFYLSTAVYPESKSWIFIAIIMLACFYCASLGIEPLARFSGFVIIAIIISGMMIFLPLVSEMNLSYIHMPVDINVKDFISAVYLGIISNSEFILLYIFADNVKKGLTKGIGKYIFIAVAFYELVAFFTVVIFGAYGKTILFPLYSLSGMARLSILDRTEAVHVIIWVFVAFVRISLFIIGGGKILSNIIKISFDKCVLITSVISLIIALPAAKSFRILHEVRIFMYTGVLFMVFAVIIPTIISIGVKLKGRCKN